MRTGTLACSSGTAHQRSGKASPRTVRIAERATEWVPVGESPRDAQVFGAQPLEKVPNYRITTKKCAKMHISVFFFPLLQRIHSALDDSGTQLEIPKAFQVDVKF